MKLSAGEPLPRSRRRPDSHRTAGIVTVSCNRPTLTRRPTASRKPPFLGVLLLHKTPFASVTPSWLHTCYASLRSSQKVFYVNCRFNGRRDRGGGRRSVRPAAPPSSALLWPVLHATSNTGNPATASLHTDACRHRPAAIVSSSSLRRRRALPAVRRRGSSALMSAAVSARVRASLHGRGIQRISTPILQRVQTARVAPPAGTISVPRAVTPRAAVAPQRRSGW